MVRLGFTPRRVRLHCARLLLRQLLKRLEKAKGIVVERINATADKEPTKRPRHCREMFAALSDYVDGLVDDEQTREMEKHLNDCKPCVAFLDSLKSAVQQCRIYEPTCDTGRAEELRRDLLHKYQAAVAALPRAHA
jgi:RNA polymerase sigma-70 factor (ECF subfamily)